MGRRLTTVHIYLTIFSAESIVAILLTNPFPFIQYSSIPTMKQSQILLLVLYSVSKVSGDNNNPIPPTPVAFASFADLSPTTTAPVTAVPNSSPTPGPPARPVSVPLATPAPIRTRAPVASSTLPPTPTPTIRTPVTPSPTTAVPVRTPAPIAPPTPAPTTQTVTASPTAAPIKTPVPFPSPTPAPAPVAEPPVKAPVGEETVCEDDETTLVWINNDLGFQQCADIPVHWIDFFCGWDNDVDLLCQASCGSCDYWNDFAEEDAITPLGKPSKCGDDMFHTDHNQKFWVNDRFGYRDCKWLSKRPGAQDLLCGMDTHADYICRETCCSCGFWN